MQRARMQKHLYTVGMYKTALEAAFAHDAAILSTGGHARELNFPDQVQSTTAHSVGIFILFQVPVCDLVGP